MKQILTIAFFLIGMWGFSQVGHENPDGSILQNVTDTVKSNPVKFTITTNP